ncbi:MAG: DNA adenine methylase, partial [Bryobacteraceae bacterium]
MIGPLPYIGGKRRLAPTIAELLPPHVTYVEPFAGGAQLFFHKSPSPVEVLNDLDADVFNFLRVCQHHADELARWLRHAVASRKLHEWFSAQDPSLLTDVQRAARFLYLQKNSFGGRLTRQSFHYAVSKRQNYTPARLPQILTSAGKRLEHVQLECLPYEQILVRYDRPTTCFYLDPPYVGRALYHVNFSDNDFSKLADRLRTIRGRFLLSINDHPISRAAFAEFHRRSIAISYTSNRHVPRVS